METSHHYPTIGLALGGGGARGLAHIGVLKILEREGIPVHCLSGTSMGGVIASAYASGMSAAELEAEALRMADVRQLLNLVDRVLSRRGLLAGDRVRSYVVEQLGGEPSFADFSIPLALNAVDLISGNEIVLDEGSVVDAIRATIALPGIFSPVEMNGYHLVDGGVLNNIPVSLVRNLGADIVIAVDISHAAGYQEEKSTISNAAPNIRSAVFRAEQIMVSALTQCRLRETPPEIIIRPTIPASVSILTGFTRTKEVIDAGEKAAQAMLPECVKELQQLC